MTYPSQGWGGPGYFASQLAPETVRTDWTAPGRRAGIIQPRPQLLGDILGGTFRSVRFAPSTMFGVPLIAFLVTQLLSLGLATTLDRAMSSSGSFGDEFEGPLAIVTMSQLIGSVTSNFVGVIVAMALIPAVFAAVSGKQLPASEAVRNLGRRFWPATAYWLLCGLALAAPTALMPVLLQSDAVILGLALLGITALAGLALTPKLLFAPCALAVEQLGPIRSIRRSWQLSRGRYWPILGTYLLTSTLISMAAGTVGGVFSFVGMLFALEDPNVLVITTVASQLTASVLSVPLVNGLTTLLYVDSRIRNEGYDLELSEELYG